MKIKQLELTNFRRFEEFSIKFEQQLTVLVARNGAGKTSILDAVATALGSFLTRLPKVTGIKPKYIDLRVLPGGLKPAYMRIACEARNGVRWDRTEKRDATKKTVEQIPPGVGTKILNDHVDQIIDDHNAGKTYELPVFIYYGTGRGVFHVPERKRGFGKTFSRFDALREALASRTNFKGFVEYFYFLEDREIRQQKEQRDFDVQIPELKAIREAVKRMVPEFSNPRGAHPAGIKVDWDIDGSKRALRIEQLSDGYRTTLVMTMDIASRMAEANPDMQDPLNTDGVVLIDEVDLHLHPGWQQHILPDLTRTFPNAQFIVTTHSPQVVTTVSPASLRVIDWQDDQPRLLPVDFSEGAEAQQVLKQILGVDPRPEGLDVVTSLKNISNWSHKAVGIQKRRCPYAKSWTCGAVNTGQNWHVWTSIFGSRNWTATNEEDSQGLRACFANNIPYG